MRFVSLLTTGAMALAATAAVAQTDTSQTGATMGTTTQTSPTTAPTPAPSTPAGTSATATTGTTAGTTSATTATGAAVDTATAPQIVQPAVGVTVFDPAGTSVGTIKSMDGEFVTLQTAAGPVRLPVKGVGPGRNGAVIGLTAAQLNAQVTQAAAAQAGSAKPTAAAAASEEGTAAATTTTTRASTTATTKRSTARKSRRHR